MTQTQEEQFAELVARMRAAQKHYFQKRTSVALNASLALEAEVDKILKNRNQGSLPLVS